VGPRNNNELSSKRKNDLSHEGDHACGVYSTFRSSTSKYLLGHCTALVVGSDDVASSYSIGVLTRRQVGRRERGRGAREVARY